MHNKHPHPPAPTAFLSVFTLPYLSIFPPNPLPVSTPLLLTMCSSSPWGKPQTLQKLKKKILIDAHYKTWSVFSDITRIFWTFLRVFLYLRLWPCTWQIFGDISIKHQELSTLKILECLVFHYQLITNGPLRSSFEEFGKNFLTKKVWNDPELHASPTMHLRHLRQ